MELEDLVVESRDGDVVTLTPNHPERTNALSREMRCALTDAFKRLNCDASCRAIVLTGAGGNFSSGAEARFFGELQAGLSAHVPYAFYAETDRANAQSIVILEDLAERNVTLTRPVFRPRQ